MNYYSFQTGVKPLTKNDLKALMLLYLTSDDFDVTNTEDFSIITGHLSYSLSNLNAHPDVLTNPIYSTEFQNTVERFDKPIIESGDIVLCAVDQSQESEISKFYNEFVKFNLNGATHQDPRVKDEKPTVSPIVIYIGVSNSSKTEFNTPFDNVRELVITSQKQLGELLVNTDF